MTASVHYIRFAFTPAEVDAITAGPVAVVIDHPNYQERTELGPETVAGLVADRRGA